MLHERVQLDFDLKACTFTVNRLLIVFLFSYLRYFQNGQIKYLVMQLDVIADVFFFFLRKKQNPELFKILQKAAIAY
jgi:hypothetical protein